MLRVMHCSRNCSNGIDQSTPMKPKGYERFTSQVAMSGPSPWRAAVGAVSLATRLFSRSNPTSRFLADRAKTRCDALYGRAESEISRFLLLCSLTGREIRAALDVPRSFRTVCKIFAPASTSANGST